MLPVEVPVFIQTNLLPQVDKDTKPLLVSKPEDGLELRCRVNGRPRPLITWYLNGQKLQPTVSTSRVQILEHRQLVRINYITQKDEGLYKCKAENRVGNTQASHMVLLKSTAEKDALYAHISLPVIVAVVIALILVVLLIILAKICYNKQKKTSSISTNSPPWKEPPTPPTPRLTQFELPLTTPPPSSHYSNEDEECRITLTSRQEEVGLTGGSISPIHAPHPHPCCNSVYASRNHCHNYQALPTHEYIMPPCQMSYNSMCDCQSTTSTLPRGTLERQFPHIMGMPIQNGNTLRLGTPLRFSNNHRSRSHSPSRRSAEY